MFSWLEADIGDDKFACAFPDCSLFFRRAQALDVRKGRGQKGTEMNNNNHIPVQRFATCFISLKVIPLVMYLPVPNDIIRDDMNVIEQQGYEKTKFCTIDVM